MTSQCECGIDTKPPADSEWWRPDLDCDPGTVKVLAMVGEDPNLQRYVREEPDGWEQYGAMVNYYIGLGPLLQWHELGRCWANTPHPVQPVRQDHAGLWVVVHV